MQIELRELSPNDGKEILEMLREIGPGENGFMNDGYDMNELGFRDYLYRNVNNSRGIDLQPQWVPQTKYWLVIDGYPVGIGKLRHYLNDKLRKIGGHIGYCIRPAARGKGYGNILLQEMLKKAKEKGIPRALVTCDEQNIPSRKVIEYNGGKLEPIENGECLYLIEIAERNGIRELHIDDYDEVNALWSITAGMGLSAADSRENIQSFLLRNRGMSFCYSEDGRIIGTILCGHDGRRGFIYHATVVNENRGKGVGRMLVEKSLKKLKEVGIHKCHLFVFRDNDTGNAFWSRMGWVKRDDLFVYSKNICKGGQSDGCC